MPAPKPPTSTPVANQPPNQTPPSQPKKQTPNQPTTTAPAKQSKSPSKFSILKPTKSPPTKASAEQVTTHTSNYLKITGVIIVILIVATYILSIVVAKQNQLLKETSTQILATRQGNDNLQIAMQFIQTGDVQIDLLLNALPGNETQLVDFVRTVEAIGFNQTTNLNLKFNASGPTGTDAEKYIPFKITLNSDIPNFVEFLKKFEKLPYIIEIISIESEKSYDSQDIWTFDILANIYVQDPFKL
ncbi:type 4a pilus biogenesis protein PilO [Pseudomonadota bacterium]